MTNQIEQTPVIHQISFTEPTTVMNGNSFLCGGYSIVGDNLLYQPYRGQNGSIIKYGSTNGSTFKNGKIVNGNNNIQMIGGGELIPEVYREQNGIRGCYIGTCNGYTLLWQPNHNNTVVALNDQHTYTGGLEVIRQAINNNFNEEEEEEDDIDEENDEE